MKKILSEQICLRAATTPIMVSVIRTSARVKPFFIIKLSFESYLRYYTIIFQYYQIKKARTYVLAFLLIIK